MLLGMADTPVTRVNVRLDVDVAELLEKYCELTRRSKTAAINVLLASTLPKAIFEVPALPNRRYSSQDVTPDSNWSERQK